MTPRHAIKFIEDGHRYVRPDGKEATAVSRIVELACPYDGPPGKADNGKFIHLCNEVLAYGDDVDDDSVPDHLRGRVNSLRRFHEEFKPKVQLCETPLFDPAINLAGTPDLIVSDNGGLCVIDIKHKWRAGVAFQVGAYRRLLRANFPDLPLSLRSYDVSVTDTGYVIYQHVGEECEQDFLALLRVYRRVKT